MSGVDFSTTRFREALRTLHAGIVNNAHQALKAAVHAAHEAAARTTLFRDVTGNLRGTITEEMTGPLEGKVRAGAKYARFVNDGTPPHTIAGKRGGTLHFVVQGHDVFRKVVHHPGTKPRPFMGEAADAGEQALEYGTEYFTDRAVAHFNNGE
jgi:Bacteriophage HK97-gp10, putative tail-component